MRGKEFGLTYKTKWILSWGVIGVLHAKYNTE